MSADGGCDVLQQVDRELKKCFSPNGPWFRLLRIRSAPGDG